MDYCHTEKWKDATPTILLNGIGTVSNFSNILIMCPFHF
jgi:hypothetical protein